MSSANTGSASARLLGGAAFVVVCELVGLVGALTTSQSSGWYEGLDKPFFQPPAWVFGPTWIVLYAVMGIAAFLVFEHRHERSPRGHSAVRPALTAFAIQLGLNGLWTPAFFGWHMPMLAFIIISALWVILLITLVRFWIIHRLAGILLVPYLLWVSFAMTLNIAIVLLN